LEPSFQLKDIANAKIRDLARGLLDRKAGLREQRTTLGRLLSTIDVEDLKRLDSVLRGSQLYGHLEIVDEFPRTAPFEGGPALSLVADGPLALEYVAYRIAENAEQIGEAFELFGRLNDAILLNDDHAIVLLTELILEAFGHSLMLARKAAVVVGFAPKDSLSFRTCTELLSAYGINGKNYGMMATIDAIGLEYNYLDLKSRFRNFANMEHGAPLVRKLSYMCFNPLAADPKDAALLVAASYEISLLDAAFALLAHNAHGVLSVALPHEVASAWTALSTMPDAALDYFSAKDPYADLHAFRAAPAFLEYDRFRALRLSLQPIYDLPELRPVSNGAAHRLTAEFFSSIKQIPDLVPPRETVVDPLPEHFDVRSAGILSRSCAFVWVCDRDSDFSSIGKSDLARLMGRTFELDRLASTSVLRRGAATASDQFVQLILQTLLRAHSSATRDSYNFKDKFQQYVRQHHDGNILRFMEEVRSLSENVVHYFITLLDETMLSQMAFLMASSDAIYETRAALLEWFAEFADDEMSRDKARQLRLDRKIAAVRGAINETRLNIDGVRFRQWIEQNKLTEFSDFIRQSVLNLPTIGDLTDSSKSATRFLTAHREPTMRALLAIIECYEEFCKNADFGIASFLGRRIRHGTLRGTLLNGLPDSATIELPPHAMTQYDSWKDEFSVSINAFAARLYFRDKAAHRDALLSADVQTPQQWQACLVCLKAIYDQAQQDSGVLFVPSLIEQYCWFIFESELAKGQASIGEARAMWGTLKLRHSSDEASAAFEKSVNIAVGDQFSTVASWFRRPPNISPVAELDHVMQVVFQEARDEYHAFNPKIEFIGEQELQLIGATYYVAYDALTIAVRNAAKHGRHPGSLWIGVEIQDSGSAKLLTIQVESLLKPDDSVAAALLRINEAGKAGPKGADVVEQGSGIRKLQKMLSERRIISFEPHASTISSDRICVSFSLPFEGIVE